MLRLNGGWLTGAGPECRAASFKGRQTKRIQAIRGVVKAPEVPRAHAPRRPLNLENARK